MPTAPLRPCTHPGCPALSATGRCEKHKSNWANHQKGRSSSQRGYGAEWRKVRKFVIDRDQGLCQNCLLTGKYTPGKEVDHIIPKSEGGTDSPDNLQLLCIPCHRKKTAEEANQSITT